jgi:hypothetical protein
MITRRHTAAAAAATLAGLALVTGCSSSGGSTTSTSNPTEAATSAATAAPEVNPAGDIPDNQAFVAWSPTDKAYTLKVPEGWAQSQASDGGTVFTDKLNSITVTSTTAAKAPTVASVTAGLDQVKRNSSGWTDGTVVTASRKAGPVIVATYRADAAPDPVTGKTVNDDVEQYTFYQSGTVVTLTLAGPHGADNVDPWRIVTDSFTWTP